MKVADLKKELEDRGLSTKGFSDSGCRCIALIGSGSKAELQKRLGEHDARAAADNVKKEDDIALVKRVHSEESEGIQAKRIKEG